ncbi:MAG: hypothetical protein IT302_08675 [Dehalococcoidia bacterium]|nr:hypothetical protein [Dehalococcoidia bacterium]
MSDASDGPRVLLAIGNPERERYVLSALHEAGCSVAGRYLDGPSLVQRALDGGADIVVASVGLHRLTTNSVIALREAGVPVLLLAPAGSANTDDDGIAFVVPEASEGPTIVAALREAIRRGTSSAELFPDRPSLGTRFRRPEVRSGEVVALVSGKGAPGTTTIAIGLAAVLGFDGHEVLLIDGDLRGGAVGPYLDLDPRRGLAGLGMGSKDRPGQVFEELQDGPGFSVLAGVERPEAQERLRPELVAGALPALMERFDVILIDAGETINTVTSPTGAALVKSAERVLVVTTADVLGLWNARSCLRFTTDSLGVPPEAVTAIVNRHGRRNQYGVDEVERALGIRVLGLIPDDLRSAARACASQVPITAARGKAPSAIADLASHLTGRERIELQSDAKDSRLWRRLRREPAEGRR